MEKTMSVCPSCFALNNIDTKKALSNQAVCGKCGAKIKMSSLVSNVSGKDLQRIIQNATKPVIVDFWASWCGPCKIYGPIFEKASLVNQDAIFLKVNTEEEPQISEQMGIRGIPATIVFKNAKEYRRQAGALPIEEIKALLK